MRSLLLSFVCILFTGSAFAQIFPPDYRIELGINGGASYASLPNGTADQYSGTKPKVAPDASIRFNYNLSEFWQVGADLSATKWESTAMWPLTDIYGQQLQPQKVTIVMASPAIAFDIHLNRMVPFYSRYKEYNKANFYYGVALGLVNTVNDGSIATSTYGQAPDAGYTYTSKYDYGYGIGWEAGVQVGFSYYITQQFGVNIELAGRYTDVGTNETRYDHANARYNMFYYPCNVGLKWRF